MNGGAIMANFDAVLFDFDGTVADTGEGVFFCVRYAIDVHSLEQPSDEEIRKFIGPPMTVSFHTLYPWLTEDDVDSLMKSYRRKYDEIGMYKYYIYDGMVELLQKLKANGVKTAVASSKPQDFLERILVMSGIDKQFDCIVGADRKYKDSDKAAIVNSAIEKTGVTDRSRILMVGDRKFDIDGAKGAGIKTVAVLYGFGSREEFMEHEAEYIVKNTAEVRKIIFGE